MSLYNMVNGVNPCTFFILPMLGHHPDEYPRFRDCFVTDDENICVYTRTGGGNRDDYEDEINWMQAFPEYIEDQDDDFDSTYASFIFKVPDQFKDDFIKLRDGHTKQISVAYKERLYKIFPKLKDKFDKLFAQGD